MATSLAAVRLRNAAVNLAGKRAVVIGGTSGIGQGIAVRLAQANASVTIVGRNPEHAAEVLTRMRATGGGGEHEFIPCDAQLLSNVRDFAAAYVSKHPQLDFLVLTQGMATIQGRTETAEGLDQKLALHYWSRMGAIVSLLPSLRAAARAGRSPRVLTVLTAGVHPPYTHYVDDPELKTHYSVKNAADAATLYNDIAVDALSRDAANAGITFIHAAPGFVNTRWGTEMPAPIRWLVRLIQPLGTSTADCAEFMCDPLFRADGGDGGAGAGAGVGSPAAGKWLLMSAQAQPVPPTTEHDKAREVVWPHTLTVLARAGIKA